MRRWTKQLVKMPLPAMVAFACVTVGSGLRAADSATGKVLLSDNFEAGQTGQPPAKWQVLVDKGNTLAIAEPPAAQPTAGKPSAAVGRRSVRFTDTGGTAWKPLISGAISGEGGSFLRLDCDWFLPSTFDDHREAFTVQLRGEGNIPIIQVAIGGPDGLAVLQKGRKYLPLRVPIQTNQWNHLTIISDPISNGEKGAFDLIVTQGKDESVFPNISFSPNWKGDFPKAHWHSPTFALGLGAVSGPGKEAYLDNVKVEVVAARPPR